MSASLGPADQLDVYIHCIVIWKIRNAVWESVWKDH